MVLLLLVICSFEDLTFGLRRDIFHPWDGPSFHKLREVLTKLLHTTGEQKDVSVPLLVEELRGRDPVFLVEPVDNYFLIWAVFLRRLVGRFVGVHIGGGVGRFGLGIGLEPGS